MGAKLIILLTLICDECGKISTFNDSKDYKVIREAQEYGWTRDGSNGLLNVKYYCKKCTLLA